jgi:hypothetical protein
MISEPRNGEVMSAAVSGTVIIGKAMVATVITRSVIGKSQIGEVMPAAVFGAVIARKTITAAVIRGS